MLPDIGLGSLRTTFGPNKANTKVILYVMPVFIIVGLILITSIPVGGIVMLLIAVGLFWGYRAQMRARVEVYDKGLVAADWLGRRSSFRWEEVTAVYEFIGYYQRSWRPIQWVYTAHTKDGQRVKLDMAYEKINNLGHMVQTETGKLLLPTVQETFRNGGTVSFGEQIAINARGFVAGGETLAWDDVDRIEVGKAANLTIHRKGQRIPWKLVMHNHIANFPTFQVFLHEAVKGTSAELALEDSSFERSQPGGARPVGNIGTISAAIGYDVRELLMQGYTMPEIQRVVKGEITLVELLQGGPKSKK